MEQNKAFEELKNILVDTVSGIEKQKKVTRNLQIVSLVLGILISVSIVISWVASPIMYINRIDKRLMWVEYYMRKIHPETKEFINKPFVTRGSNEDEEEVYNWRQNMQNTYCSSGTDK